MLNKNNGSISKENPLIAILKLFSTTKMEED